MKRPLGPETVHIVGYSRSLTVLLGTSSSESSPTTSHPVLPLYIEPISSFKPRVGQTWDSEPISLGTGRSAPFARRLNSETRALACKVLSAFGCAKMLQLGRPTTSPCSTTFPMADLGVLAPGLEPHRLGTLPFRRIFQYIRGVPSISVTRRIVLRANNKTSTLLRTLVDRFNNIYQLLLILQHPVQLVVVASAEIAHHVFVAEEEHERDCVVEFYTRDVSIHTRGDT
jgi:hypothetical protein